MKIRNGFVSNSSSSSFIIEILNSEPCKTCGRSDNIIDLLEKTNEEETGIEVRGKNDVLDYVKDWLDKKLIEEIEKAKGEVLYLSVSYYDETFLTLLHNSKDIKIIYNNG